MSPLTQTQIHFNDASLLTLALAITRRCGRKEWSVGIHLDDNGLGALDTLTVTILTDDGDVIVWDVTALGEHGFLVTDSKGRTLPLHDEDEISRAVLHTILSL